jgi:predicted ATP-binding protein involved in virulence
MILLSGNAITTGYEPAPPICYAYGAGRRSESTSTLGQLESEDTTRSLFVEEARLLNAEEWLLRLDYSASKSSESTEVGKNQKKRLELVTKVLTRILPDVADIRFSSPTNERPDPGVEFQTSYGRVSLRQLGYGYRTMIAWMVDFANRMVDRYPESPDPLAEPAVVLVDEIDLHLHPKWQRELIGFLTERFPNTQFIATAHSPLIVQAASEANIALLRREGDHVVIENHPETIRGWRVDQILTSDLFGLETARPPELEGLLLRRKELLTKPKLTRSDKKELTEIESKLGALPTGESFEQAKTMELIRESIDLLKWRKDHES